MIRYKKTRKSSKLGKEPAARSRESEAPVRRQGARWGASLLDIEKSPRSADDRWLCTI